MRKLEVSLCSYSLDPVRVITEGSIVWGEWNSVATRGMWWGAYYGWWGFKSVSKIMLGEIVESSFRWLSFVYSA